MNAARERVLIRMLHLVLSVPIVGFLYGPVSHIPPVALFTRVVAFPLVVASGMWLWLKPRLLRWWREQAQMSKGFTR
jgi:hypothetical protein